jgi:hypothetical protein
MRARVILKRAGFGLIEPDGHVLSVPTVAHPPRASASLPPVVAETAYWPAHTLGGVTSLGVTPQGRQVG